MIYTYYKNFIISSMEIKCSLCPSVVLRCTNLLNVVPWNYIICQNCATNGFLKKQVKKQYDLIERVVYQQESNNRVALQKEYQSYKKKFYLNETAVFDALVNQKTHTFTQKFIKFIENVKKEEPKFKKDIQTSLETIHETVQNEVKRAVIGQVKQFNNTIKKEEEIQRINVKKVEDLGTEMKNKILSITFQSDPQDENPKDGKRIFDEDQVIEFIDVFNKKKSAMNKRVSAFSQLFNEGEKIAAYEKIPEKKVSDIVVVEQQEE